MPRQIGYKTMFRRIAAVPRPTDPIAVYAPVGELFLNRRNDIDGNGLVGEFCRYGAEGVEGYDQAPCALFDAQEFARERGYRFEVVVDRLFLYKNSPEYDS